MPEQLNVQGNNHLLIEQWKQSQRLNALIEGILEIAQIYLVFPLNVLIDRQNIDNEEVVGQWLDDIGTRLGLARPTLSDHDRDKVFGFSPEDVGFDQAPFDPGPFARFGSITAVNDAVYRAMLQTRGVQVRNRGGREDAEEQMNQAFQGKFTINDNLDTTFDITLTDVDTGLVELYQRAKLFPTIAGVKSETK